MRTSIRKLLINDVATISERVYEPSAAGPDLEKPYIVLREGVQSETDPYKDFTTIYEVWPYTRRTTFQNVDSLSKEVVAALHRKKFDVNGVPHYIEYTGTITDDIVDEEWDALTRGLRFQVFSLAWLVHTPVDPDPVEAMKYWTEKHFASLQTNPLNWNPTDKDPALYWRQDGIQSLETTNWGAWINARLHGHVIAPDISTRKKWTEVIVRQLALDDKIDLLDGSRMRLLSISADSGYDPFQTGQIAISVRFGVLESKIPSEKLRNIYLGGDLVE